MFNTPTHPPVEFQNLIGVIAHILQTDPQVVEALGIAELDAPLSDEEAIAAAEAAVIAITGPTCDDEPTPGGLFIIRDDGRE
jgi:hypothetical protein